MNETRVVCRSPREGAKPTRIDRSKFELVRRAILKAVPRRGDGVRFGDLPRLVASHLSQVERDGLGSISWYTTTVKLELEVRGELRRVAGSAPQRLIRT